MAKCLFCGDRLRGNCRNYWFRTSCTGDGADGVMVVNPYYAKLSDDAGLCITNLLPIHLKFQCFSITSWSDRSGYWAWGHYPAGPGIPNIVGIKDTIDNISHTREVSTVYMLFVRISLYSADMTNIAGYPVTGRPWWYSGDIQFCSNITRGIYQAVMENDLDKARLFSNNWQNCLRYTHWSSLSLRDKNCHQTEWTGHIYCSYGTALPLSDDKVARVKAILEHITSDYEDRKMNKTPILKLNNSMMSLLPGQNFLPEAGWNLKDGNTWPYSGRAQNCSSGYSGGSAVKRYGQIIGFATRDIRQANIFMCIISVWGVLSVIMPGDRQSSSGKGCSSGYLYGDPRKDGRVATRNYIGVLSSVNWVQP